MTKPKMPRFSHSRKESAAIDAHNAANMKPKPPKDDPIAKARKYLSEYTESYDAMRDGLATREDHAISVNELLRHLRAVLAAIDSQTKAK